ncbi:unnamed protein product, partial [Hapterophycus canaliculatus]
GWVVAFYHEGLCVLERDALFRRLVSGDVHVVCCTAALGLGVDLPGVRLVVHRSAPRSTEQWMQESGRAG